MIGAHAVQLFTDRNAGGWGQPVASNPWFDLNADGWGTPLFAPWTWANGELSRANVTNLVTGQSLSRDPAYPVAAPLVTQGWRVRTVVRCTGAPARVELGVAFAPTPAGAFNLEGPYTYVNKQLVPDLQPGGANVTLEWVFPPQAIDPSYIYAAPRVVLRPIAASPVLTSVVVGSLEFNYRGMAGEDVTCLVDSVSIHHGREDPTGQPDASTATLDLSWDADAERLPDALEIGAVLQVTTDLGPEAEPVTRFIGRVTDLDIGWDEAAEDTPDRPVGQVIAAGFSADLGRRVVGDAPFPQELDGARVSRVLALAGVAVDMNTSDPGTVQILPRDIDSQPALEVAQGTAESANGLVWVTRTGEVRYADAEHRRGAHPVLTLDACDVLVTPTWKRTLEGLVNRVSIGYGPTPEEGEQPRWLGSAPDSITRFGEYAYTATTELATEADAANLGRLLLGRQSQPAWLMVALPVDVKGLDAARTAALLLLDVHDLVTLTGLPAVGTAPTTAHLFVEGWTERLAWGEHEVEMYVSGYCRTAPPPRWDDMDPAITWDSLGPALTWDGASCLGPPLPGDRWADVPANLRWNQVDPATTWNTWTPV